MGLTPRRICFHQVSHERYREFSRDRVVLPDDLTVDQQDDEGSPGSFEVAPDFSAVLVHGEAEFVVSNELADSFIAGAAIDSGKTQDAEPILSLVKTPSGWELVAAEAKSPGPLTRKPA